MWTGGIGGSEERVAVKNRWPIMVPNDQGRTEPGWLIIAIGETGVDVCQTRTGRLRGLSWDELFQYNPAFNIDALLADEEAPPPPEPVKAEPPAAPAPTAAQADPAAPATAETAAGAATPPPAPSTVPSSPPPTYRLLPGRPLAVPDGNGGMAPGRWEVASTGPTGVTALKADGETTCELTWGQVLLANPDFLPPSSQVRMANGRLGLLIGYHGDRVTVEGAASYDDASRGLRSQAFVDQQFTESIEAFGTRNAERIG